MTEKICFPCSVCCGGWLTADIAGVKIMPGKPCAHIVKEGCGIYKTRPRNPCAIFKCGWLLDPDMPEHMRPDKSGAIILTGRFWNGRKVIRAVPAGEKIPAETLEWLMALSREQNVPLTFTERICENGKFIGRKRIGYGPPSFIEAVKTEPAPEDLMKF